MNEEYPLVKDQSEDFGIAGFSLSLIGFLTSIFVVGIILSLIGMVSSAVQVAKKPTGLGITGLVLGIVSFILSLLILIYYLNNFDLILDFFNK